MIEFLLAVVILWFVYDAVSERLANGRERKRQEEKIELRRRVLAGTPDSPSALETLGDAMREAGHLGEALRYYEEAERRAAALPGVASGAGLIGGSGLDTKIRLTRFELSHDPEAQGLTLRTRQQVCRRCGNLNLPTARTCETCGEPLPVDSFWESWQRADIRSIVLKQTAHTVAMWMVVLVLLALASHLPLEVKGVLIISTTGVVLWRVLRAVGGQ